MNSVSGTTGYNANRTGRRPISESMYQAGEIAVQDVLGPVGGLIEGTELRLMLKAAYLAMSEKDDDWKDDRRARREKHPT